MRALRNNSVDLYARASDYVDQVISQTERLPGASWWHTGFLTTSDSRMSTSLGNFVTIRDALATASARAIRFAFFSSHYRSPMELTDDTFSRAARALARLDRFVEGDGRNSGIGDTYTTHGRRSTPPSTTTSARAALAVLFDLVREQNGYGTRKPHARALVRDFLATFALDADAGSAVVDI